MGNETIEIPGLRLQTITVQVEGDSPLIQHKWSEKAKKQMEAKQQGKASRGRQVKKPKEEYAACLYEHPSGGYGHPAIAFKAAAVRAAKSIGMPMTDARQAFHITGELVKLKGKPSMREDMVRVANGAADIRYRAQFKKWTAELVIRYNESMVTAEQVINLINISGFGTGVGEWRPEKGGAFGTFHVSERAAA